MRGAWWAGGCEHGAAEGGDEGLSVAKGVRVCFAWHGPPSRMAADHSLIAMES